MSIDDLTKQDEINLMSYQDYAKEQGISLEAVLLYLLLKAEMDKE